MIRVAILFLIVVATALSTTTEEGDDKKLCDLTQVTIGEYTQTPTVVYQLDARDCLLEACALSPDNTHTAIENFQKLYALKHPGIWDVVVGYEDVLIKSPIYVELHATDGVDVKNVLIFN